MLVISVQRSAVSSQQPAGDRRGSILLIVLVLVVLLSLAVYTFTELAISEVEAVSMFGRGAEARAFADSGIEVALSVLGDGSEYAGESLFHRPDLFAGILLKDSDIAHGRGRFSILVPVENDPSFSEVRNGLINESGKLNLNTITKLGLKNGQDRMLLMALPDMTVEIADAILDWLDSDFKARRYGAESVYYLGLPEAYAAANGPLGSLDEMLLVRGVTPELLYGDDANRNGLLEADEGEGDGVPRIGWNSFLTIHSREASRNRDGSKRIDLNNKNLAKLYDAIEKQFDSDAAKFVVGYRLTGDKNKKNDNSSSGQSGGDTSQSGGSPQQPSGGAQQPGGRSQGGPGPPGKIKEDEKKRGGIDLTPGAKIKFESIYDLLDAEVEVIIDGEDTTLESPWSSEVSDMRRYLPEFVDNLSTSPADFIEGRININHARREVLLGLPEMTESLADAIVSAAPVESSGAPIFEIDKSRKTSGWLMVEGLVTLEQMRKFDRYITTGGDVYRLQSIGYFEAGGPVVRLEALIDAVEQPPVVLEVRDLSELGKGYSRMQLASPEDSF